MLVSEKQMQEGDGLFIYPVSYGLGYQLAGAFQRLGRRMESFQAPMDSKNSLYSTHQLPIKIHNELGLSRSKAVVFAPHLELSFNQVPNDSYFEQNFEILSSLRKLENSIHDIWVLPTKTSQSQLKRLREYSSRATVLLSPATFGFRDAGLFDESLKRFSKKPGLWLESIKDNRWEMPLSLISFSELAGHIVTLPQNEKFMGKTLWIESSNMTLNQWREKFVETFTKSIDFWERLASRLSFESPLSEEFVQKAVEAFQPENLENLLKLASKIERSSEVFPSPQVSLVRNLQQLSQAHQRYPDLELVFTPSRAP